MQETKQTQIKQIMQKQDLYICRKCGAVYQISLLKPGDRYNDFTIRFCPWCSHKTQTHSHWIEPKVINDQFVMVTIAGGLINQVIFYKDLLFSVKALFEFVRYMDIENEDAGIYDKNGLITNAKDFLNENDEFIENSNFFKRN